MRNRLLLPLALAAAAAVAAAPVAASPPEGDHIDRTEEVRIPMAGFRIRSFRPDGMEAVYFRVGSREWYRATLVGSCWRLPDALRIGFDTHGSSTLDNTSSLIVDGESCRIHSLVRSEPPPRRRR